MIFISQIYQKSILRHFSSSPYTRVAKNFKGGHYKGGFTPGKLQIEVFFIENTTEVMEMINGRFVTLNIFYTQV